MRSLSLTEHVPLDTNPTADELKMGMWSCAERIGEASLLDKLSYFFEVSTFRLLGNKKKRKAEQREGTAYVRRTPGGAYHIVFDINFINKYLKTEEDALFVLLHELEHMRRGDLLDRAGSELAHEQANVVADMLINAELCRYYFPKGVPFFESFYQFHGDNGKDKNKTPLFMLLLCPPPILFKNYRPLLTRKGRKTSELVALFQPGSYPDYFQLIRLQRDVFTELVGSAVGSTHGHPACVRGFADLYTLGWYDTDSTLDSLVSYLRMLLAECPSNPTALFDEYERSDADWEAELEANWYHGT